VRGRWRTACGFICSLRNSSCVPFFTFHWTQVFPLRGRNTTGSGGALSWKEGIYQEHWGIQILYSRYYHPQTSYDILPRSPRVYWYPQSRSLDIVYVTLHVSQQRTTRNQTELENVSFQTKQKQKSWNQCPDSNVVNCPPVVRAGITEGGGAVGGATLSKFPL
jgi:hypothetical protein